VYKGLFILNADAYETIYPSHVRERIAKYVDIYAPPQTADSIRTQLSLLGEADFIFSGWGGPLLDHTFLDAAPRLKAFFYGAGSVKGIVTDAFWERKIPITSAYAANAVPVAEYTVSQILFALKLGWHFVHRLRTDRSYQAKKEWAGAVPGAYGSTVGLISLGMVGRKVRERLRHFDVRVIAYDPFVPKEEADRLDVELCPLEDVFRRADVVSLHTPWLKETEGMITGAHLASMKPRATFINTSRGAVVKEREMIEVLKQRPDLYAVLDVTYPEPPAPDSPLYTLPNVVLTPHIAGSMSKECGRMGMYMAEELERYCNGEPFRWEITKEKAAIMA